MSEYSSIKDIETYPTLLANSKEFYVKDLCPSGRADLRRCKQLGDPDKAAQAILQIAQLPEPPLRLLLGSYAIYLAGIIEAARSAEDEKWKSLSLSTDFPGTPDVAERLGKLALVKNG